MRACPNCSEEINEHATRCEHCGANLTAEPDQPPPIADLSPSGQGAGSPLPPDLSKRSWFGFWSPILYGIVNRVWWFTVAGVALIALGFILPPGAQRVLGYASFGLSIAAYTTGGSLAWRSRAWESVEAFRTKQRRWAWIAFVVTALLTAFVVYSMLFGGGPVLQAYDAHGVTFEPPAGWQYDEGGTRLYGIASDVFAWNDAFFQNGLESHTLISVGATIQGYPVLTAEELEAEAKAVAAALAPEASNTPVGSVLEGTGLPAIQVDDELVVDGVSVGKRIVLILGEDATYLVRCQFDDITEDETLAACDAIARTLDDTAT